MKSSIPAFLGSLVLGAALTAPFTSSYAAASSRAEISRLAVSGRTISHRMDPSLLQSRGTVDVVVQLSGAPLAVANGENSRRTGGIMSHAEQVAHSARIRQSQDAVLSQVLALGGKEIARVRIAYNAAIVRIDASKLRQVAAIPGVSAIKRVNNYRINLKYTVPYIGATAAQALGLDGTGVRVAVLDSGIDYTHRNLGGAGTVAAYRAAYGTSANDRRNKTLNGLFPTKKVIGGYDFVGEAWDGSDNSPALAPDPDPIDADGHGTHVADIIAGKSNDGKHVGVAPGASLYAVKVCSALSTSCSGIAILEGLDFALDPNGDGSMDDAVDIINVSIGAPYGQREDSTSAAATNAARAGVLVAVAAGNSGDKPYVMGSPGESPDVITVAETQVPTARAIPLVINSPASLKGTYGNTATVDWGPIGKGALGDVVFVGRGCKLTLGDTFEASPRGKIALIDRGDCNVSEKVRAASDAGALGVLIGLVAPGDAVSFSNGSQCPDPPNGKCKPTLVIQQELSEAIKANIAAPVNVTISDDNGIMLVGSMASTSSRGPSFDFNQIKPDIAAPGASTSADVGTGTGELPFGGTSGATPMVSGSAAILIQAYPRRAPYQLKSLLMNTAETEIYTNPALDDSPFGLAPITRIGGGEVRVDRALASTTAAWDQERRTGSLSFGYLNVSAPVTVTRRVTVQNYSSKSRRYAISKEFRYDDDNNGAVSVHTPPNVFVPGYGTASFDVSLRIDPAKLPTWLLNGGADGGAGSLLQSAEFDGYLHLKDETDDVHLAWQVLPHKSAEVAALDKTLQIPSGSFARMNLRNTSRAKDGDFDVFALTGTSPRIPASQLPADGDDRAVTDIAYVGVRAVEGAYLQFAFNTYGRRAHPAYPAEFDIYIDVDRDGIADYDIFTVENGGPDTSGQTVVAVLPLDGSNEWIAYFFADADLDSGNMIMTVPMAAVGVTPDTQFKFDAVVYDNYFAFEATDSIEGMAFTPSTPKFTTGGIETATLFAGRDGTIPVTAVPGGDTASPSQSGLLLMYRDAKTEADAITVRIKGRR